MKEGNQTQKIPQENVKQPSKNYPTEKEITPTYNRKKEKWEKEGKWTTSAAAVAAATKIIKRKYLSTTKEKKKISKDKKHKRKTNKKGHLNKGETP